MRLLSRMIGGEALRGIRVEHAWRRKPPLGNRDHAFPRHPTLLTATAQNVPPHALSVSSAICNRCFLISRCFAMPASMASRSLCSSKGFGKKSIAPAFIAWTDEGMSP